jgi:hypothetical protein
LTDELTDDCASKSDSQVVELLGRHHLMNELLRAGLEVAVPARDRGIDMIAYADLSRQVQRFAARPIQMKASSGSAFGINRKYTKIADLLIAHVWHVESPTQTVTFAMTYNEVLRIADEMRWTRTPSWAKGAYSTRNPSKRLREHLEPFRINPERWWSKVIQAQAPT